MPTVTLSKDLKLPAAELATKVVAALGMRGSGKSNVMASIAEQLLAAGIQVVVLDDVGIWFSLRLKPDGKTPSGLDIPVLGGRHGDIPLLPTAGALVATSLAETGSSAVLDISGFRKGERARFAAAFAETLFHAKKEHAGPLFLILEESQRWVPQVIRFKGEGEERMLGAFMEIAEVGRNYGLGLGLLSQRPQKVHKEVLNLTELLFAFQTNGVLERKALAEWVQEAGAEGRDQVHNQLPGLPTGEALVWSPAWLRLFQRTKLPKKTTYDAGATPLTARAQVKTRPLELGKLSDAMAAVTEEAKASDPKALRADNARLRAELAKAGKGKAPVPAAVAPKPAIPARVMTALEDVEELLERSAAGIKQLAGDAREIAVGLEGARALLVRQTPAIRGATAANPEPGPGRPTNGVSSTVSLPRPAALARRARDPLAAGDDGWAPSGGARRILESLATSMADGLTWRQLATLAGMKPTGGGFNNYKSALRTRGCVEERGGLEYLTETGRGWVGEVGPPPSGPELVAFWKQKLPGKAGRMLEVVIAEGPISRTALAGAVEMEPGGGGFNNYLSNLRSNGLVEDCDGGLAPAEVFLR